MRKLTLGAAAAALLAGRCLVAAGRLQAQEQAAFVQWQSPDTGRPAVRPGPPHQGQGRLPRRREELGRRGRSPPRGADYPGYGTICERTESRSPAYVNIDCVWDTTAYPNDGGPAQNRPYVVRISVQGGDQSGMFSDGRSPAPIRRPRRRRLQPGVGPP